MEYKYDFKHVLLLNLVTILVPFSAIFAKLITLTPYQISFFRCGIAAAVLFIFLKFTGKRLWETFRRYPSFFIFTGILLGFHWAILFKAIHVSSVSVAILAVFSYPVITTLLEPFFFKLKLVWFNLFTAALVLVGIGFLVPEFNLANHISLGVSLGVLSALLISVRNLWTKKYVHQLSASEIMFFQTFFAALILIPSLFFGKMDLGSSNLGFLLAMALVSTVLGHNLFVYCLKFFRTSTASIITAIEPFYGILLAVLILKESPQTNIILGGILIVGAVLVENIKAGLKPKRQGRSVPLEV